MYVVNSWYECFEQPELECNNHCCVWLQKRTNVLARRKQKHIAIFIARFEGKQSIRYARHLTRLGQEPETTMETQRGETRFLSPAATQQIRGL